MIFSMTAYGSSQVEQAGYRIGVEIRAVNSRYLDLVLRFPKNCLELEDQTRKRVSRLVRRGRVEVQVQFEPLRVQDRAPRINRPWPAATGSSCGNSNARCRVSTAPA